MRATKVEQDMDDSVVQYLDPEVFQLVELPSWVLHPDGAFRATWDLSMVLLLGYVATSVPLVIFIIDSQHDGHVAFDLFVDALFIIDIGLNFLTAYFDPEDNKLVTDKRRRAPDACPSNPVVGVATEAVGLVGRRKQRPPVKCPAFDGFV